MAKEDENEEKKTNWGLVIGIPAGIILIIALFFIYKVYSVKESNESLRKID